MGVRRGLLACLAAGLTLVSARGRGDEAYEAEIKKWRSEREARLKEDGGWLTVSGLFWLKEGANRFGSAPGNDIVLPSDSSPPEAGVFEFSKGTVEVKVHSGVAITAEGKSVGTMTLTADTSGSPEVLSLGALQMHLIERGGRYAIRLKDMHSAARREFKGLRWFPIKDDFRIVARFVPYPAVNPLRVPNILGQIEDMPSPGYAVFQIKGQEVRLDPVLEEPGATELFFIFRDLTSGKETYPSGRFLYAPLPREGSLVLDFNKAYNPPCAFTAYATCPLPPQQNRHSIRIEAGELNVH
jgi:uncharacterized protein (DUF1684 family)